MRSKINREGPKGNITLPAGMTLDEAMHAIQSQQELEHYDNRNIQVIETISCFPYEAVIALFIAIKELHGDALQFDKPIPGGVIKARMIGIPVSTTEGIQVPWGPFTLPDIEGEFQTKQSLENGMAVLQVHADIKRRYMPAFQQLIKRTRELAATESIYVGQAIRVRFRDDEGKLDIQPPTFMDLTKDIRPIFSKRVDREVAVNILVPIRDEKRATEIGVSVKRGVMLQGDPGCGKTLTAYMVAREATKAGRTFVYVQSAAELPEALRFAASYAPAVLFIEDIDRVMIGPRTKEMDRLLNNVDGVDTKDAGVLTILTTNDITQIHPAFLREGRMDAIIKVDEPDADAAERLVRAFCGKVLDKQADLAMLRSELAGRTPAFIREVVERAKLDLLLETKNGDRLVLTVKMLENAYLEHLTEREAIEHIAPKKKSVAAIAKPNGAGAHV